MYLPKLLLFRERVECYVCVKTCMWAPFDQGVCLLICLGGKVMSVQILADMMVLLISEDLEHTEGQERASAY